MRTNKNHICAGLQSQKSHRLIIMKFKLFCHHWILGQHKCLFLKHYNSNKKATKMYS